MAKTATLFYGPAQLSNAAATKYTVPAGNIAVIRHIHVENPSGSPVTFTMSIGADAAGTRIYDAYSIPGAAAGVTNSVMDFFCYYPVAAGTVIQAFGGTNNILTLTFGGDLLSAG